MAESTLTRITSLLDWFFRDLTLAQAQKIKRNEPDIGDVQSASAVHTLVSTGEWYKALAYIRR